MEMTLTVHVPRRRPHPVDVVVEWSGRSHGRRAVRRAGRPPRRARAGPELRRARAPARRVRSGCRPSCTVRPSPSLDAHRPGGPQVTTEVPDPRSVLDLVVVGGPDAGRSHPLSPPGVAVGRAPGAGLVVDDESLSRSHLYVAVGSHGVTVEDSRLDQRGGRRRGRPSTAVTAVDATSTVVVGSTTLRLRRAGGPGPPARHPGDGTVRVSRHGAAPARHRRGRDHLSRRRRPSGNGLGSRGSRPWRRCPWRSPWRSSSARSCCCSRRSGRSRCSPARSATAGGPAARDVVSSRPTRSRSSGRAPRSPTRCAASASGSTGPTPTPPPSSRPPSGASAASGVAAGPPGVRLGLGDVPHPRRVGRGHRRCTRPAVARAPLVVDLARGGLPRRRRVERRHRRPPRRPRRPAVHRQRPARAVRVGRVARTTVVVGGPVAARRDGSLPQAVRSASRPVEPGHPAPSRAACACWWFPDPGHARPAS